jgi:heme exporter protein CcmD
MSLLELPHVGYVIAAYTACALVIALLIGATALDYWVQRRALAAYEARQSRSQGEDE